MFTNYINIDWTLFKLWFYFPFRVYGVFSQPYLLYFIYTEQIGAVKVLHNPFWQHIRPSMYHPKSFSPTKLPKWLCSNANNTLIPILPVRQYPYCRYVVLVSANVLVSFSESCFPSNWVLNPVIIKVRILDGTDGTV